MRAVKGNKKDGRTIIKTSLEGAPEEFTIKAGMQVWQLNLKTGLILLAEMEDATDSKGRPAKKIVEIQDGFHVYLPALNRENAKTKFNQILAAAKR